MVTFSLYLGWLVCLEQPSDVEVSSELILHYRAFAYFTLLCLRQLTQGQGYDRILFMFGFAAASLTIMPKRRESCLTTVGIEPVTLAKSLLTRKSKTVFPSGPPSKYYPGPTMLNFRNEMITVVFIEL